MYRVSYVKGGAGSRGFTPSRKVGDQPSVTCVLSFGILRDRRGNGGNANIPCFVVFSGFSTTATKTSVWSPILALGFLKGLLLLASASGRGVVGVGFCASMLYELGNIVHTRYFLLHEVLKVLLKKDFTTLREGYSVVC